MSNRLAQRYAQALYDVAQEQKKIEDVCSDVKLIKEIYDQSSEFRQFCESPSLKFELRSKILKEVFKKRISDLTHNFLALIAQKSRLNLLGLICHQFDLIFALANNIQKVEIQSSYELAKKEIDEIAKQLKTKLKKNIISNFTVDPDLIGGVRIQVDDVVYDNTVKFNLDKLRQTLIHTD